jgi:hypothetical protein
VKGAGLRRAQLLPATRSLHPVAIGVVAASGRRSNAIGKSIISSMIRTCMAALLLTSLVAWAIAGPDEKFTVTGIGTYPISHSILSMWLAGPDHRPLLMVYFHGPEEWHNTKWKVDSKFEKRQAGLDGTTVGESDSTAFDGHRSRRRGSSIWQV